MSKGFASNYRVVLLAVAICLCFGGLGARLVELHVFDRDEYLPVIDRARRQIIVESARRGDILDDRGNILATSQSMIVLGVDPQAVRPGDEKKWPELAELTGLSLAEITKKFLTKTRGGPAEPFAIQVTKPTGPAPAAAAGDDDDAEVDDPADANGERPIRWEKLCDDVAESTYAKIRGLDIQGVYGNRVYRRVYPHNSLAAHVIGYVNKSGAAVDGIERYADFYLHGRDGWREGERDGRGHEIAQFRTRDVPAADGYSVTLSLDLGVQHIVEQELDLIAQKFQPQKATIIVSDPRTGFILALANYPTFDLNEYNKVPRDDMRAMRDVAITDQYEPGSCFKIVAIAGALNENLVTPQTSFDCSINQIEYEGRVRGLPREDQSDHFKMLTVAQITARSSNRGAAQLAMLMGDQRFYDYARAFGFGQLTGFPLPGEIDGTLLPPNKWDALTITRMPMGHSVDATALQMQMAMGVIASGGYLLRPQVIREIRDTNGRLVYSYDTVVKRRVISEQTARTMARLLMGVASTQGTAPTAAIPNYEVAGKTGTAQKIIDGHYSEHHHVASFIGFFPASRPQVAISVIVDDADAHALNGVAYGTSVAAPSFKHIGEQLIQYLGINPVYAPAGPSLVMGGNRP
ncbi:MAG TPA: penicillin-binding protein 2 [Opitutus sp.]|nr:penicillin-binding protein 2 [Opitutus sp.]